MQTAKYIGNIAGVREGYDVVIIGGGTAGAAAAISAGREGLKTLVVEQFGSLGGTQTLGLVNPVMPSLVPLDKGHCSIHKEIVDRLFNLGYGTLSTKNDGTWFDPVYLSFLLEEMTLEAGAEIMFHTAFVDCATDNGTIKSVFLHNKDGITQVKARYFIDSSGDAELAVKAGVPYESGDYKGLNQPASLRFEMANVDVDKVKQYLKDCGQRFYDTTPGIGTDGRNAKLFRELLVAKCNEGELQDSDISHFQFFSIPGKEGFLSFNCPELPKQQNITDAGTLTMHQTEGKKAIVRIHNFCRKNIPGFEAAVVSHYSPMIGIRESRRIKAKYILSVNDVLNYSKFPDAICQSNYPFDVHGNGEIDKNYAKCCDEDRYYEMPYRMMVSDEVSNLAVAGRCAGSDFYAHSTARVQHACRAMGEAAGIAAGIAKKQKTDLNKIDGTLVRDKMKERNRD